MYLQMTMELADLQKSAAKLFKTRKVATKFATMKSIEKVKKDFTQHLEENNFKCKDRLEDNKIKAIEGSIAISLTYPLYDDEFINLHDASFELAREDNRREKRNAILILERCQMPFFEFCGQPEDQLASHIAFYKEQLLPRLKENGTADITGNYSIAVMNNSRRLEAKTIPGLIDELLAQ